MRAVLLWWWWWVVKATIKVNKSENGKTVLWRCYVHKNVNNITMTSHTYQPVKTSVFNISRILLSWSEIKTLNKTNFPWFSRRRCSTKQTWCLYQHPACKRFYGCEMPSKNWVRAIIYKYQSFSLPFLNHSTEISLVLLALHPSTRLVSQFFPLSTHSSWSS